MLYNPPTGGAANDPYVGKNVAAGTQGSKVPPGAVEFPQREIMAIIAADPNLTPTNADLGQAQKSIAYQIAHAIAQIPAPPAQTTYGTTSNLFLAKDNSNNFGLSFANGVDDARTLPVDTDKIVLGVADGSVVKTLLSKIATYVLNKIISTNTFRQKLTGNLTVYASSAGNDGNDGTSAHPYKTIQGAINAVFYIYDLAGFTVTIQLLHASGETTSTFAGATFAGFSGNVVLLGDSASGAPNQSNFVVNCGSGTGVINTSIQTLSIVGLTLDYTYNGAPSSEATLACAAGGVVFVTSCTYNCGNNRANLAENFAAGGQIIFASLTTITVTGAGSRKYFSATLGSGSSIQASNGPVSTYLQSTGAITYTGAFAQALNLSSQNYNQAVFSGFSASSGTKKYEVGGGSNIAMANNANFLPGGVAGTSSNNLNGYS